MARLARIVIPGVPHHVTQRGNGRAQTFFSDDDYALYRALLGKHCRAHDVSIWAWVLMPNHVHLVVTPGHADGVRAALSKVHRAYAGHIHAREKRSGHFWQGRFGCVAMDEAHVSAAVRYILLNPVRARLGDHAEDWRWSSVHAHLAPARGDGVTDTVPVATRFPDLANLLASGEDEAMSVALRRAESIGRPVGDRNFLERIGNETGREIARRKPGPKREGK